MRIFLVVQVCLQNIFFQILSKARIITEVRQSHFDRQLFDQSMLVLGGLKYQLFFKSQANCLKGYFHIYKTLSCFPEFYHLDGQVSREGMNNVIITKVCLYVCPFQLTYFETFREYPKFQRQFVNSAHAPVYNTIDQCLPCAKHCTRQKGSHEEHNTWFLPLWSLQSSRKNNLQLGKCCKEVQGIVCCFSVAKLFLTLCDPMELHHTRLACLSLSPGACSNSCPLSHDPI